MLKELLSLDVKNVSASLPKVTEVICGSGTSCCEPSKSSHTEKQNCSYSKFLQYHPGHFRKSLWFYRKDLLFFVTKYIEFRDGID